MYTSVIDLVIYSYLIFQVYLNKALQSSPVCVSVHMCDMHACQYVIISLISISSVQFSHSVVSDSLRPRELQHARPPCPSPTPGVHPDSRPSSQWCHPAISSSVVPFSSCLKFSPASGSFLKSQFFISSGQSIGVSASASVLPMNIWTDFL